MTSPLHADDQARALKLYEDGNFKEAFPLFKKVALSDADDRAVVDCISYGVQCLQNNNRTNETDDFREQVYKKQKSRWRVLKRLAESWASANHYGYMIAGEFKRGHHRGGGEYVQAFKRDRVRALQLYDESRRLAESDDNKDDVAQLHFEIAQAILQNQYGRSAWRLQTLTDLSELPDFEAQHYYHDPSSGYPVGEDGNPVFFDASESWDSAKSDGERWAWLMLKAVEIDESQASAAKYQMATQMQLWLGVQTMQSYYWWPRNDDKETRDSAFALHTLTDNETMARLATGIKRFELPEKYNFVKAFRELAESKVPESDNARNQLANIYLNRRQYPRAANEFRALGKRYHAHEQVKQIEGNWCQFESGQMQAAGRGASFELRFRNANRVEFTAQRIDVEALLDEMKSELKKRQRKDVSWEYLDLGNLGHYIVKRDKMERFVKEEVSKWTRKLQPRENHFDRRVTVTTPLQDAGVYLVTAKVPDGNECQMVIWLADMAIYNKHLGDRMLYVVTDARTGKPMKRANVEFVGYRVDKNEMQVRNFAEYTDANGFVELPASDPNNKFQWVAIARQQDRLAFLGFSGLWSSPYNRQSWKERRGFAVTDRPVYRPDQEVQYKVWIRQSNYSNEDKSLYAGEKFTVRISNPKGEEVHKQSCTADEFGGIEGTYPLPNDATLGQYTVSVDQLGWNNLRTIPTWGNSDNVGATFRVEEYKKPEFEVTIDAPKDPLQLGDSFTAKVEAKYYFGSPVTEAKVKYKVLRTRYDNNWYPPSPWDWLYGPGYWWCCYDYDWYPGWRSWGCRAPYPWYFWRSPEQPEVVASGESDIRPDGTLEIKIDTTIAKEMHGDKDHSYQIQAEVVDQSRRTIVGNGRVLVARSPFKVHAWLDRGYYRVGDTIRANFAARTIDGKPVEGEGKLTLLKVAYKNNEPTESKVDSWDLATGEEGNSQQQIKAGEPGQYRLSYTVTDAQGNAIEGGYVFTIIGDEFESGDFRFADLEIVPERREYRPGEVVKLQVNTNRKDSFVQLYLRPSNGVYQDPETLYLDGKSAEFEFNVTLEDMPNFFVEAVTVANGKLHTTVREIFLPPEKRVLNVDVEPSSEEYKPGEKAQVKVRLTDHNGEPYTGSTVVSVYDKSVEYISGGSNVPEIRAFFWKWRRHHQPNQQTSLLRMFPNHFLGKLHMRDLGVFGRTVADDIRSRSKQDYARQLGRGDRGGGVAGAALSSRAAGERMYGLDADDANVMNEAAAPALKSEREEGGNLGQNVIEPEVRSEFADTAYWIGALRTDSNGFANIEFDMPENLTNWRVRVWGMGHGTRVGEGDAEVVTRKNLIVRLQAPRFFIDTDEVVLSANVHNYLDDAKDVQVRLELDGGQLAIDEGEVEKTVRIDPDGEARVDWRVKVTGEGTTTVRMLALTDEESDAMQMDFPVYIHGMLQQQPYSGSIRPEADNSSFTFTVPKDRRAEQTRLELRYSPTLAAAMLDAVPYMVEYPYGCTEQTLNRFLPAAITRSVLKRTGVDLEALEKQRNNLNAQEIGNKDERRPKESMYDHDPVFDSAKHLKIVEAGVQRLTEMQLSDGGWGWFSGRGEHSSPHTTAVVVHGLQVAERHDVAIVPGVLNQGVEWLQRYQRKELEALDNYKDGKPVDEDKRYKVSANHLDALVFMVLTDSEVRSEKMLNYLYRDRTKLAPYSLATYGLALHRHGEGEKLEMVMRNIEQFLVEDNENQTAYLNLPGGYWWYWYGSEYEAQAYYLKLLVAMNPNSEVAPKLVKYLLNNRRHATYWNSTRDTALVIEAFADYLEASGELDTDMTVEVWVDGKRRDEVAINRDNLFTVNNTFVLTGDELDAGEHTVELRKSGEGALYYNAYVENFTLEDFIKKAGLEIRVQRKYYRLVAEEDQSHSPGARGQAVQKRVEKYRREALENLDEIKSGDLVEIELEIESKNDYEYILFEDMKPAGFEPVDLRSGYTDNEMRAYVEYRDNRVAMFVQRLARGAHSLSYRMRAETPGKFSALPTRAFAMYAPELKANSDEIKLRVSDAP